MNGLLTKKQIEAAKLAALGESAEAIGRAVGATGQTVRKWKEDPDFINSVNALVEAANKRSVKSVEQFVDRGSRHIASKENRIEVLNDLRNGLLCVIQERADFYRERYPNIPGGQTGLVYTKNTKEGVDHVVDNATISQIQSLHTDAAAELGQRRQQEFGKTSPKLIEGISEDDL